MADQITFEQLNIGWNAEPNAPELNITVHGTDVVIRFYLNAFAYEGFSEGDMARITFHDCFQYRDGSPDHEGFYCHGKSRYKKYGVKWGEFYLVHHSDWKENFPDAVQVGTFNDHLRHYLFYFRDETFECIAASYSVAFC
ncbi:MAG: hypothetical protein IJ049_05280 [Oscillospiraceae bacterium]|nr:hypothetical protein [Oscillospiraceae bacterium]